MSDSVSQEAVRGCYQDAEFLCAIQHFNTSLSHATQRRPTCLCRSFCYFQVPEERSAGEKLDVVRKEGVPAAATHVSEMADGEQSSTRESQTPGDAGAHRSPDIPTAVGVDGILYPRADLQLSPCSPVLPQHQTHFRKFRSGAASFRSSRRRPRRKVRRPLRCHFSAR